MRRFARAAAGRSLVPFTSGCYCSLAFVISRWSMLCSWVISSSVKPESSCSLAVRAMVSSSWHSAWHDLRERDRAPGPPLAGRPYGEVAWVRNAREAGQAELLRGRTGERIHLREATAEEAVPVLRSYLRQLKRVVGPYFDVTRSSPDPAFVAEAPRHPVFLLTAAATSSPGRT
jgi:hypothetical protein